MNKTLMATCLSLALCKTVQAQKPQHMEGPYAVRNSIEFKSPKKHLVANPIPYGDYGIIQVNMRDLRSFNFQKFSNDLKYETENTVDIEGKFSERSNFNSFVKFKNKTYLFAREVFREEDKEGIAALEFNPKTLSFTGSAKSLFKSSDKVLINGGWGMGYSFAYGIPAYGYNGSMGGYDLKISEDKTKFLYTYSLKPKERKDAINKEIVGIHVYDENLSKLWGGEYEMPYVEAKMDNLGFILADDGSVYLLAKVYEGDNAKEGRKDKEKPNYHFEVLIYEKGKKAAKMNKIQLDNNRFPTEAWIYEDATHAIAITGFYSKGLNKPVDGAYMVKMDNEKGTFTKINGGYFEIPAEVIKAFTSDKERRKIEKKERKDDDFDLGITNLEINSIFTNSDGSTRIVAEQYYTVVSTYYDAGCKCMRTKYDTYALDVFILAIGSGGKLDWVKKIPKAQHSAGAYGPGISINTLMTSNNDLHIFYVDNLKNFNLPVDEAPKWHQDGRGGFLNGVTVSANGNVKKYNLGEIEDYKTRFSVREFVNGGHTNLISSERRKKKNVLYSIEIK
ncbi:hypothetical protein CNR22_05115 [Sphingobacteriaceae bacterium]|nr:hypothetical protein CNR22_05115 [Sphingobacteriaceae bacterium]